MNDVKPWEEPRVKRILELFGGKVTQIKTSVKKVEVKQSDIER